MAKVKPDGTGLVYAGYIGGGGDDSGLGIAVSGGFAYVVGHTTSHSNTFSVTVGPGLTYSGGGDAFVAKVKTDGSGLVYAGYIGGDGNDFVTGVAVNSAGNAFVVGGTASDQASFPVKTGPGLAYNGGEFDGFIAKVKSDGTGLVYAGYIGGERSDTATSVAVDSTGNAYVTGRTKSDETSFPVTVGPDLTFNGNGVISNTFVAKVKPDGTGFVYSGYIGPGDNNIDPAIAIDSANSAYVAGTTSAETGFPLRFGPQLVFGGGATDAFVTKVKPDGSGLIYSGYIGGSFQDSAAGIAVDAAGNAYIAGTTLSHESSFPILVGPDKTYNGDEDLVPTRSW